MPAPKMVVKLWCLPRQTEDELKSLHQALVAALVKADIGVEGENDVIVLFPVDMMAYGLGSEIVVEISISPSPRNVPHTVEFLSVRNALAGSVGSTVKELFPAAEVQCSIPYPDPKNAVWCS